MKVCILNLTRFGDLLQTGPTILGLKEIHPDCEITVVVDRNFAPVCEGLPGVDRIWALHLDAVGRLLLALYGAESPRNPVPRPSLRLARLPVNSMLTLRSAIVALALAH